MAKRLVQQQFNHWLGQAYADPDSCWRRRLGRWYASASPLGHPLRRRVKRALQHHARKPAIDLGWQPIGVGAIAVRASSANLLTAPLYLGAPPPRLFALYGEHARPGSTAIDVGSNNGAHALVMAHWVGPSGRVYGFEPTPRMHAAALANCRHNGADHVEIAQVAVADREGEARFEDSSGESNPGTSHLSEQGSITVRTVTLDDTIPADAAVALIKIDVEGHELAVLRGAQRLLLRCRPAVVLEFNLRSYGWEELIGAFPYPVRVAYIPARHEQPLTPLADGSSASRLNSRHIDVLITPA